jgi:hypothetical protein
MPILQIHTNIHRSITALAVGGTSEMRELDRVRFGNNIN